MSDIILKLNDVSAYTHRKDIFKDINLEFQKGHIYGLLGHNGSGKSTILRLIANQETPMKGEIFINGNLNDINVHNKDVVIIPDTIKLFVRRTIKDNVDILAKKYDFNYDYFLSCLKSLKLDELDYVYELSKGNQEIVQLVLYFSINTKLYLLDEPFSAIDIYRREFIQKIIIDCIMRNPESSIIITTHLINEIQNVLDGIVYLDNGDIVLNDTLENLLTEDQTLVEFLKDYFKEEVGYEDII